MDITNSQLIASLKPCFYARSIVMIAPRRLTEKKHLSGDEFYRETVILSHFTPTDPVTVIGI